MAIQVLDDTERAAFVNYALETALSKLTTQAALRRDFSDPKFTDDELASEQWKTVTHFPDFEVSKLGRVRRIGSAKTMKLSVIQHGYRTVGLIRGAVKNRIVVHLVVAQAFLPNPNRKSHVNHRDGKKQNNRLSNLEWTTVKENNEHASATGLRRMGANHPMAIRASASGAALRSAKRKLSLGTNPLAR